MHTKPTTIAKHLAVLLVLSCIASTHAQRNLKDIPDPDPQLELKELEVHPDFEITLYAADPRIAKPIQMNFDPKGRLWIASSEVYPQIEPGKQANDKILVLEDQDHDGIADTTTVFASGLLIPTGVIPGDGGAYVANSTELLHLADTNGDGVADRERVLLSGFGTEDTHHILHTLRWGPDGLLYMNQSIYIHSHIETPYGVRRMNGAGVWHFRPETLQLETYTLGLVNPWGHVIDEYGQSFETDGAGGDGIIYVFPDFVGKTSPGAKRVFPGLNPGKPKLCGLEIVGGSHWPNDWRGDLITNDFRAHRVCRYKLREDGAGFAATELEELVKSRHQSFRPIDVKLGPDGAIYIADWYNPIIQHGEVDFRDPRRDHTHGRIWRVAAKGRKPLPYRDLTGMDVIDLLELLRSEEPYWRQHAHRVLKERGKERVLPALKEAKSKFADRHRLELLWVYQSLNVVDEELLSELLAHEDPRIRAGATRVLYHWRDKIPAKLELLKQLAVDDHPRVRMEAAHVLRRCSEPEANFIAMSSLAKPTDRFIDFALKQTADQTKRRWLPTLRDGSQKVEDPAALLFSLDAAGSEEAVPILLSSLPRFANTPQMQNVMQLVAARGDAEQLGVVFSRAMAKRTPDESRELLLKALIDANRRRKVKPTGDLSKLADAITSQNERVQAAASELAGLLNVQSIKHTLGDIAKSSSDRGSRLAAIRGLSGLKANSMLQAIAITSDIEMNVRVAAVSGLFPNDSKAASDRAVDLLNVMKPSDDPSELIRSALRQEDGNKQLSRALQSLKLLPTDVAKVAIRVARSSGRDATQLVKQLNQLGNLDPNPVWSAAERESLLADAKASGDPAAGENVYRVAALNCQKCHAIGGAGGKVGPDLVSIGASAPADYILQSLLEPNAKIKENYHSKTVLTDEGQLVTGILIRQTDNALLLRDAEDKQISIPLDSIEEQKDGDSLMPAGLLNDLTRKETVDLLRFLTELGKVGPYATPTESLVREWKVGAKTVFSRVNGSLPLRELAKTSSASEEEPFVSFSINMNSDGKKTLKLRRTLPSKIMVDSKDSIEVKREIELELTKGSHTVSFVVDSSSEDAALEVLVE